MRNFVAILGLALAFLIVSQYDAHAMVCAKRDQIVDMLAKKHKEFLVSGGMATHDVVMELYASEGGQTWSLMLTNVKGVACVVAVGSAYYTAKPQSLKGPKA